MPRHHHILWYHHLAQSIAVSSGEQHSVGGGHARHPSSVAQWTASPTGGDQRVSASALRGFVGSYLIEWVDYVLHDRLCMLVTTMYRDKFSFLCPRTGLS
jgi:hypothetical protein